MATRTQYDVFIRIGPSLLRMAEGHAKLADAVKEARRLARVGKPQEDIVIHKVVRTQYNWDDFSPSD